MARKRDAEKTAIIAAKLALAFPAERHAVMWEVANGTGWQRRARFADLIVQDLWPSDGLHLHGFEIKSSRTDLRRELADPAKHHEFARYCNTWTLVTYDTAVVGTLELPERWGWWALSEDDETFEKHRKATVNRSPEPLSRQMVAALLRRAVMESPNADYTGRVVERALAQARKDAEYVQRKSRERAAESAFRRGFWRALGHEEPVNEHRQTDDPILREHIAAFHVALAAHMTKVRGSDYYA